MKNSVLTIIIGLFIVTPLLSQENIKFPVKSALIKYNSTGLSIGASNLYFDNFGSTLCEDYTGTLWDQKIKTRTIVKDSSIYILDLLEKTYTYEKMSMAGLKIYDEFYFDEETYEEKGFVKEADEIILSKHCFIYSSKQENSLKLWVWKGLILKKEDDLLGGSVLYATSFEELPANDKIFEVSAEFKKQ
jgi:hypothetical protein